MLIAGVATAVPPIRHSVLRSMARALVVDEPLERADVIVVPLWAGSAGAIDAADLLHSGMADRVAVLAGTTRPADEELARRGLHFPDQTEDLVELLRALGLQHVEVIGSGADGTEAEGRLLPPWCDERHLTSIIVVSAPDHSRRVRRVLRRSFRRHQTKVRVRASRFSAFVPETWWWTRGGVRTEIVELQKLIVDIAAHPFS